MQEEGVKFVVDVRDVGKGLQTLTVALDKIDKALKNVDNNASGAFDKLKSSVTGLKGPSKTTTENFRAFGEALKAFPARKNLNFTNLATNLNKLANVKLNSAKVKSINNLFKMLATIRVPSINKSAAIELLASALKKFRAPTKTQTTNFRGFVKVLATMRPIDGTFARQIAAITSSLATFKAPSKAQTENFTRFVNSLSKLKIPNPRGIRQITTSLQMIAVAARRASDSLSKFRGNLGAVSTRRLNTELKRGTKNIRGFQNAMSLGFQASSIFRRALGTFTLGAFLKSVFDSTVAVQQFQVTMQAVRGSARLAGEDFRFVGDLADRLALNIKVAQKEFAQFATAADIAGFSTKGTQRIFESIAVALRVMGRSTEDQKLSFLALQQIISKGQVQTEELRRQLGERFPGAVALMAEALGVTTARLNKLLKAGKVLATEDTLTKFADRVAKRFSALLPAALERVDSKLQLLQNSFERFRRLIGQSGFIEELSGAFDELAKTLDGVEFRQIAQELGQTLGNAVRILSDLFLQLLRNMDKVKAAFKVLLQIIAVKIFINLARDIVFLGSAMVGLVLTMRNATGAMIGFTASTASLSKVAPVAAAGVRGLGFALRGLLIGTGVGVVLVGLGFILDDLIFKFDDLEDSMMSAKIPTDNLAESVGQLVTEFALLDRQTIAAKLFIALKKVDNAFKQIDISRAASLLSLENVPIQIEGGFAGQAARTEFGQDFSGKEVEESANRLNESLDKIRQTGLLTEESIVTAIGILEQFEPPTKALEAFKNENLANLRVSLQNAEALGLVQDNFEKTSQAGNVLLSGQKRIADSALGALRKLINLTDDLGAATEKAQKTIAEIDEKLRLAQFSGEELTRERIAGRRNKDIKALEDQIITFRRAKKEADLAAEGLTVRTIVETQGKSVEKALEVIVEKLQSQAQATRELTDAEKELITLRERVQAEQDLAVENKRITTLDNLKKKFLPVQTAVAELSELERLLNTTTAATNLTFKEREVILKAAREELEKIIDPSSALSKELQRETVLLMQSETTRDVLNKLIDAGIDIKWDDVGATLAQNAALVEQILAFEALREEVEKGPQGLQKWVEELQPLADRLKDFQADVIDELSDSLANLLTTGEFSIKQLGKAIIAELNKVVADEIINQFLGLFGIKKTKKDVSITANSVTITPTSASILAPPSGGVLGGISATGGSSGLDRAFGQISQDVCRCMDGSQRLEGTDELAKELSGTAGTTSSLGSAAEKTKGSFDSLSKVAFSTVTALASIAALSGGGGTLGKIAGIAGLGASLFSLGSGLFGGGGIFSSGGGADTRVGGSVRAGGFREGGISDSPTMFGRMAAAAFKDAPQFQDGTSNTSGAIPAILHDNEAVIPLSRNRAVPVELSGNDTGTSRQMVVKNTFNIQSPDVESFRRSKTNIQKDMFKATQRANSRNG